MLIKWKEKRVAFYGAGYFFEQWYPFFVSLQPECILLDKQFLENKKTLCNLPIYEVEEFVQNNKDIHIICFAHIHKGMKMKRKLINALGIPQEQVEVYSSEIREVKAAQKNN